MSMCAPSFSSRNIIKIIHTFNIERKGGSILYNGKVAPTIFMMFIQLNYRAIKNTISYHLSSF